MSSDQIQSQSKVEDDTYLTIWRADHEFTRTRWTVATFFLGISFAVLGFSFQSRLSPSEALAIRISGLFIYWFAYLIYVHFHRYTDSLRAYLIAMEKSSRTTLDLESKIGIGKTPDVKVKRRFTTVHLLFCFGLIYTTGIVLLLLLGL